MPSVKVTKRMPFLGGTQEWSNRYHFTNDAPTTDGRWQQFCDNIEALEKTVQTSNCTIVKIDCYEAGSDLAVKTVDYNEVGTRAITNGTACPGDVAALVRYSTTQRTSKNHPIYLFNYYHDAWYHKDVNTDEIQPIMKTALEAYATAWLGGISDGVLNHERAGPNGAVAQTRLVELYLTHRDFRR